MSVPQDRSDTNRSLNFSKADGRGLVDSLDRAASGDLLGLAKREKDPGPAEVMNHTSNYTTNTTNHATNTKDQYDALRDMSS